MPDSVRIPSGFGQSLWLDQITRSMLREQVIEKYRDQYAVTGLTSNPTIFEHAIQDSTDYDVAIRSCGGMDPEAVFFDLALEDLRRAAAIFEPVYRRTNGVDGYVSLEISPLLAEDSAQTVEQALALYQHAAIPNLYIKVPGTVAGAAAIAELTYRGVPVNVTLLFSPQQYQMVADAYLDGLERRLAEGLTLDVSSVASVFISRWDVKVAGVVPDSMRNQLGLAVARNVYAGYRRLLQSSRMQRLMNVGARPQRLLWASTGSKDPHATDTLYVDQLIAPLTVNTIPEKTLLAVVDHGQPGMLMTSNEEQDFHLLLDRFVDHESELSGMNIEDLARKLQHEGTVAFVRSWNNLLATIRQRMERSA